MYNDKFYTIEDIINFKYKNVRIKKHRYKDKFHILATTENGFKKHKKEKLLDKCKFSFFIYNGINKEKHEFIEATVF